MCYHFNASLILHLSQCLVFFLTCVVMYGSCFGVVSVANCVCVTLFVKEEDEMIQCCVCEDWYHLKVSFYLHTLIVQLGTVFTSPIFAFMVFICHSGSIFTWISKCFCW